MTATWAWKILLIRLIPTFITWNTIAILKKTKMKCAPTVFDYNHACENGKHVNDFYVPAKFRSALFKAGRSLQDASNPIYKIQRLAGDPFPFNHEYHEDTVFDLVVRCMDTTLLVTSLKTLTLNICKASFDGHTFRIPDPHKTFLVVPR